MFRFVAGLAMALVACASQSAGQAQLDAAQDRALAWLLRTQRADGSWTSTAGLDVQTTSAVLDALNACGLRRSGAYAQGVAWLQNAEAGSVDALARQIIALQGAGATLTTQRLAQRLLAERNPIDRIWGAYAGYAGSFPDTALALQALDAAAITAHDLDVSLAAVAAAVIEDYSATGGVGWGYAASSFTRSDGFFASPPSLIPTAYTIIALQREHQEPALVSQALTWMKLRQASDGGFNDADGARNAFSTAVVYLAIAEAGSLGRSDPAALKAQDYLIGSAVQTADGSYGQDAFQTALAAMALSSGSVRVDSDADGTPDAIERLLGTDPALADGRQMAGGGTPTVSATYLAWYGRPVTLALPYADVAACCSLLIGALPDGIALEKVGNQARLSGTPGKVGTFRFELSYLTTAGLERRVGASVEVRDTIFRTSPDPVSLASLFADPVRSRLQGGWQLIADDFTSDGRLDLVLWLSGADEFFQRLDCSDCASYAGPAWGQLAAFENQDGTLVRTSELDAGLRFAGDIRSLHAFDYDNDGQKDLLLTLHRITTASTDSADQATAPYRNLVLLRNEARTSGQLGFSDVTLPAGLTSAGDGETVIVDANRDGSPDIVLSNGSSPAKLYLFNRATGAYQLSIAATGLGQLTRPAPIDYDGDGLVDIVSQDGASGIAFYRSNGTGTFSLRQSDIGLTALAARRINRFRVADLNNDGRADLVAFETAVVGSGSAATFAGSRLVVLENRGISSVTGNPTFVDITPALLATPSNDPDEINYGGDTGDYDNDGRIDIAVAAREVGPDRLATIIVRNESDGGLVAAGEESGLPRGVASFDSPVLIDVDDDGALDLLLPSSANTGYRLLNNGTPYHYLSIAVRAKNGGDALGARVEVTAGALSVTRTITIDHAHGGRLHFGLGAADSARVQVHWPSGLVQDLDVPDVDRLVTIVEP